MQRGHKGKCEGGHRQKCERNTKLIDRSVEADIQGNVKREEK